MSIDGSKVPFCFVLSFSSVNEAGSLIYISLSLQRRNQYYISPFLIGPNMIL